MCVCVCVCCVCVRVCVSGCVCMSVGMSPGIAKQAGNPTVHVKYDKPLASFDVTFYSNHLDVNWDLKYDSVPNIHGLMGMLVGSYCITSL